MPAPPVHHGNSPTRTMLVVTVPAVLAVAALRPRGGGGGRGRAGGRAGAGGSAGSSGSGGSSGS
ncbi:hypothetical protein [Kitasatospora purpeofusca]|uniref:hypothetical protein n=1 Tax=Kitasatospora purpeofusca TaxID=67352 RepID=UPI0004C1A1EC